MEWRGGQVRGRNEVDRRVARFGPTKIDAENIMALRPDHPALAGARTIFPASVIDPEDSPRLLVSGANNPKLGARVRKGPRRGWPIYHLTLEERATCPRSCQEWAWCYGNAMHLARRHAAGPGLEAALQDEIADLALEHPGGFMVRLHTLGDFYSVPYVILWRDLLDAVPALHCFGFTARNEFEDDSRSRAIAARIADLTMTHWDRFAIRFSRPFPGPQGAMVVDAKPTGPGVIQCPAQTGQTAACATCGLCWASAAQDKTVAFMRHGMNRRNAGRRST